jgi:hypothetical protein
MIELRQDLTLDFQPRLDSARDRAAVNHLDRHLMLELGIRTFGEEHFSHTADTQGAQYAVRPDTVSFHH